MRTGFNTEVKHGSTAYHVQTEDKGTENPLVETLVYVGGQILDAIRTPYDKSLAIGEVDGLMEKQHRNTLQKVKTGVYAATISWVKKDDTQSIMPQRGLDELIVDYLSTESKKDHLELSLSNGSDFIYGKEVSFEITACNDRTRAPMPNVAVVVTLFSTATPSVALYEGKTNPQGKAMGSIVIPMLATGNAAVVIKGTSELGSDELKQLVRRVKA